MKDAAEVRFEAEENGWEMHITDEDGEVTRFHIHGIAWDLAEHARATIGVWRAEGEAAKASRASAGQDLRTEAAEAYPVGSPKWLALTEADVDSWRDRQRGR